MPHINLVAGQLGQINRHYSTSLSFDQTMGIYKARVRVVEVQQRPAFSLVRYYNAVLSCCLIQACQRSICHQHEPASRCF